MTQKSFIDQIFETAKAGGISQKELAARAGLAAETLSRAKRRGSLSLANAERLAQAAGCRLGLTSPAGINPPARMRQRSFRDKYGVALAWSNAAADDRSLRYLALVRPQFHVLLDAALEHGLDTLEKDWQTLKAEQTPEVARAAPVTERMLSHIRRGYEQAQA